MNFFKILMSWWAYLTPSRKVIIINGDTAPAAIKSKNLFLAIEDGVKWSVAFNCPCGCGDRLELVLLNNVKPRWDIDIHKDGTPTLSPSIWRKENCKSHFWIRRGKIIWCN